ncbi:unnamed protein product [Rhodiola kirilowii]
MATSSKSSSILICSCIIALLVFHNSVPKSVAARSLPQAPLNADVRLITRPNTTFTPCWFCQHN